MRKLHPAECGVHRGVDKGELGFELPAPGPMPGHCPKQIPPDPKPMRQGLALPQGRPLEQSISAEQ
jgi:hypothetical protein